MLTGFMLEVWKSEVITAMPQQKLEPAQQASIRWCCLALGSNETLGPVLRKIRGVVTALASGFHGVNPVLGAGVGILASYALSSLRQ